MSGLRRIKEPGWYDIPEHEYHKDPCLKPSLSSSIAKTVIGKSLMHAWYEHARNPDGERKQSSQTMDVGKAVHAAVFGGAAIEIVEADSYRSKAAQEQRDEAVVNGLIPILQNRIEDIEKMADIARVRFDELYGESFHAERVAIWRCPRTNGWRRAMLDTSSKTAPIIVDFKTTEASVDSDACINRIYGDQALHIQAAAYSEAMEVLNPEWAGRVRFFFQWQEQKPPYALSSPIEMPEAGMELGRQQWRAAGALWDIAVKAGKFPGYSTQPVDATPPLWTLSQWENRLNFDNTLNEIAEYV